MDYPELGPRFRRCRLWETHEVGVGRYEKRVRDLWAAYARDGVDGMRRFADDDAEWTMAADGETVRGMDALAAHMRAMVDRRSVVAHAWEQHGDCVLVHGSMRTFRNGGFVDVQPSWVFFFRDDKLERAVAYAGRDEALEAIERHIARAG
jgi:ketosteroid isomerase-like protein